MKPETITLISFGYFEKRFLDEIKYDVEREFQIPVILREGYLDLSLYFDPSRRQYNGNSLLQDINLQFASDQTKTLAVFNVDLYIPILTFIFGQAFLNGRCGIASAYRLRNERYGIAPTSRFLLTVCEKKLFMSWDMHLDSSTAQILPALCAQAPMLKILIRRIGRSAQNAENN